MSITVLPISSPTVITSTGLLDGIIELLPSCRDELSPQA